MRTLKTLIKIITFGSFLPLLTEAEEKNQYLLAVDIKKRELILYKEKEEIAKYLIAVPQHDWLPLPLIGEVEKIELNPWWYPTEKTRIAYLRRKGIDLPKIIPPGDHRNALGKVKIKILFENFKAPILIHGTNEPSSIGQKISRGCIRMHNEEILELSKIIKGTKTKVIFH